MTALLRLPLPAVLAAVVGLSGCDMLGVESASAIAARKEAEGRAIGGACRHAGRAIEDCYSMNRKADKPAIFAGWREMNDYMRENKIDAVAPQLGGGAARAPEAAARRDDAAARPAESGAASAPR
jgi:hypothetical protein